MTSPLSPLRYAERGTRHRGAVALLLLLASLPVTAQEALPCPGIVVVDTSWLGDTARAVLERERFTVVDRSPEAVRAALAGRTRLRPARCFLELRLMGDTLRVRFVHLETGAILREARFERRVQDPPWEEIVAEGLRGVMGARSAAPSAHQPGK